MALVVLIVITAVRMVWLYRFGDWLLMVGPTLIPFLVGGLLLLWRSDRVSNVAGLTAVALAAGAVSYLATLGALVFFTDFRLPETAFDLLFNVAWGSLLGAFYSTLALLPVGLYALKSRAMRVSVVMGLSAVMLALPYQPVSNIAIFVIALFVLRSIDRPPAEGP